MKLSINERAISRIFILFILVVLYFGSLYNYLLFHTLAEIFSICIAFVVFVLTWNSSQYIKNNYLLWVGTAYLFIGVLDLFHTMSFKGMQIFPDYDYYANQLWIGTRYLESITLTVAFFFIPREKQLNPYWIFGSYAVITALILASVFIWKIFPVCFIDGVGLTPFKVNSEYIISTILVLGLYLLWKNKNSFEQKVYQYLSMSIVFTIISELAFTFYISNYGLSNLIGHYFKIFSFYLIYKAIIEIGVKEPFELIFRELMINERKLCEQNDQLRNQAIVDGLTGLFNHRYLYEKLEEEKSRCDRYGCKLSVILFDIDRFKTVNDTYGHLTGDEIIKSISKIIKRNIRVTDVAGRYGGEEFMVVLPETDLGGAMMVAEKIRLDIERTTFVQDIRITISGGASQYVEGKINDLVKSVDEKLYAAKNNGRNRVQA